MRPTIRVVAMGLAIGLLPLGYGLFHDGLDGFAFSRSVSSWKLWLLGLFAGGLAWILLEAGQEWLFERDHWYSTGPRRSTRLAWSALAAVGLALIIWIARKVMLS